MGGKQTFAAPVLLHDPLERKRTFRSEMNLLKRCAGHQDRLRAVSDDGQFFWMPEEAPLLFAKVRHVRSETDRAKTRLDAFAPQSTLKSSTSSHTWLIADDFHVGSVTRLRGVGSLFVSECRLQGINKVHNLRGQNRKFRM
ncbi:hypothetical protein BXY66_0296 [Shimia isoporae]|uniref:Uncharacterized protein n=1 Tax=Shimia isoporae TaxID=647720 RepID=A0A4R1NKS4_9RHOB|nr:hypothetical protein BXY66_0296 [Shimia isoporae]